LLRHVKRIEFRMESSFCDITTYAWLDHESVGLLATSHIQSLTLFRDNVVRPSLRALDHELVRLRNSDDPTSVFMEDDFAELFQKTVEGYLIATQSMWERGLRQLLINRDAKLNHGMNANTLQKATWSERSPGIQSYFEALLGVPLQAFDSYADLDLLQSLGNAIRHGNGASAQRVYTICPALWHSRLPPGIVISGPFSIQVPLDASDTPSFDSITLPQPLLEQMLQSVVWFWNDIEHMRCNSFQRKHETVVRKIDDWRSERLQRTIQRYWNPSQ